MHISDFKKTIFDFFKERGYAKKSNNLSLRQGENITVLTLQKSSHSDAYYINFGFYLLDLHENLEVKNSYDCDVRGRFGYKQKMKETDLFEPDVFNNEATLKKILQINVKKYIEDIVTKDDLRKLLKKQPALVYQTSIQAQKLLDLP